MRKVHAKYWLDYRMWAQFVTNYTDIYGDICEIFLKIETQEI